MVRQTKRFKKGLNKKVLSAILAASMIMTSSSFAFASTTDEVDGVLTAEETNVTNEDAGVATNSLDMLPEDNDAVVATAVQTIDLGDSDTDVNNEWTVTFDANTSKFDYNGLEQEPEVTVSYKGEEIAESDYSVTYYNNKDANDDAYVEISITNGEHHDTILRRNFTINPVSIADAKVVWEDVKAFVYDGTAKYPAVEKATVKVKQGNDTVELALTEDDYEIVGGDGNLAEICAVDAAPGQKCKVYLKGKGNFEGTTTKSSHEYEIQQADLNEAAERGDVTVTVDPVVYDNGLKYSAVKNSVKIVENATETALDPKNYSIKVKDEDGEWVGNFDDELPASAMSIGTHELKISIVTDENYEKGSYIETTYEVVASSLATAVKDATVTGFGANNEAEYTGADKFPTNLESALTIPSGLKYGRDYEITNTKEDWINAGEYTLNLSGLNEYAGQTATVTVKITPKDLGKDSTITAIQGIHPNSGNRGSVVLTISDEIFTKDGKGTEKVVLEEGKDYTFEVTREDTASKKGEVAITGIGNYTTEDEDDDVLNNDIVFNDEQLPLSDPSISVEYVGDYSYVNGETITLKASDFKLVETDGSTTYELKPETDYGFDGKYKFDKEAGELSVTLQGNKDYYGTREVKINIEGVSFTDVFEIKPIDDIYLDEVDKDTNDTVQKVKADVEVVYKSNGGKYNNSTNVDIKVYDADGEELADNFKLTENPGTYTVKVTPKEDKYYTGSLETTFNVIGSDLKKAGAVVADIEDQVYTSEAITPAVTVKIGEKTLVAGEDYEVTYTDNVKGGEATAIITGINNYSGTLEKNFKITRAAQAITMSNPLQERDLGNGSRTSTSKVCTLKLATTMADEDTKYTYTTSDPSVATVNAGKITYQGVGECTITVSAAATDSCEAASLDIKVVVGKPGTPTFTPSVTKNTGKKAFVVTSSTVKGVDGWEVQYSIKDTFWKATTKDFPGTKTKLLRQTCKTVHSNMTYYIRVRGYQTVNGEKVYSDWSPVKTIKTK